MASDPIEDLFRQGETALRQGDAATAVKAFQAVLERVSDHPGALFLMAEVAYRLRRLEEAERYLQAFEAAVPGDIRGPSTRAIIAGERGLADEAEAAFERALAINGKDFGTLVNYGNLLMRDGRMTEAAKLFARALELQPDRGEVVSNLATLRQAQARHAEADALFRKAVELKPDWQLGWSNRLFSLNYLDNVSAAEIAREHIAWGERFADPRGPADAPAPRAPDPERKLRVGYVSPDFGPHPVTYFLAPLLSAHDRTRFEIHCFDAAEGDSGWRDILKSHCDAWHGIASLDDEEAARLVHAQGIDILVDLAGHTKGNRLLVFARRPAPIQLTWLGYPNGTGMRAMDGRITDEIADPPGMSDDWTRERLVYLPHGFLCYLPHPNAPDVGPVAEERKEGIVFASFNKLAKVTDTTLRLWARVMDRVAGSRLLLKAAALRDAATVEDLSHRLEACGIDPARVEFLGRDPGMDGHLARYRHVDIALDTLPYNGTTTTCDALWMGVPVVTLAGDRHAGRVGASILTRIGAEAWIAADEDAYVAVAADLAEDVEARRRFRQDARERMRESPLLNATEFAMEMENAYRALWRKCCKDCELRHPSG